MSDIRPDRFETLPSMLLAGLRRWYGFDDAHAEIPEVWRAFMGRLPIGSQVGWITYGAMCQTDMDQRRFEYICAVQVDGFDALSDDFGRMRVPEARYAVFGHDDVVDTIRSTWEAAQAWLGSNSEWTDGETPTFERYGPGFDPKTRRGDTSIWVPVVTAQGSPS